MKTKIIHYGNDSEIYSPYMAQCDSDDAAKGVYKKKEMLEFVRIVTEHFLTPRQRYFYFQCVVYGKKVEDIATLEGVDDSTVYKHLKLAKKRIANVKELMRIADGKRGIIVLFQQIINSFCDRTRAIAIDFYVNRMTLMQIAIKYNDSTDGIAAILNAVRKEAMYKEGLTKDDLELVRDYYKKTKGA